MSDTQTVSTVPVRLVNKLDAYCKLARVVQLSLHDNAFLHCLVEKPSPIESEERKVVKTKFEDAIPPSRLLFSDPGHRQVGMRAAVAWESFASPTLVHVAHFVSRCHVKEELLSADEIARWEKVANNLERNLNQQISIHGYR